MDLGFTVEIEVMEYAVQLLFLPLSGEILDLGFTVEIEVMEYAVQLLFLPQAGEISDRVLPFRPKRQSSNCPIKIPPLAGSLSDCWRKAQKGCFSSRIFESCASTFDIRLSQNLFPFGS